MIVTFPSSDELLELQTILRNEISTRSTEWKMNINTTL